MDAHRAGCACAEGRDDGVFTQRHQGGMAEAPFAHVLPILLEIDVLIPLRNRSAFVVNMHNQAVLRVADRSGDVAGFFEGDGDVGSGKRGQESEE